MSAQDDAIARVKKDFAQLRGDFDAALTKLKNGDQTAATTAFNEIADDLEKLDTTVNEAAGTPLPPPVV